MTVGGTKIGRKRQDRHVAPNQISRTLGQRHQRFVRRGVHSQDPGKHGFKVWAEPMNGGVRVLHEMPPMPMAQEDRERERETKAYAATLRREGYFVRVEGKGIGCSAFVYGHSWDEGMVVRLMERIKPEPGERVERVEGRIAIHRPDSLLLIGIEVAEQIATVYVATDGAQERVGAARRIPEVLAVVKRARQRVAVLTGAR